MLHIRRSQLATALCLLALTPACGDDSAPAPTGDGDGTTGDGDQGQGDGDQGDGDQGDGDQGDGDTGNPPLEGPIEGQYWMRTDLVARITQNVVLAEAIIDSSITAYSLVEIEKDGDGYKMIDWQCQVETAQECVQLCNSATSATTEGKSFAPAQRTLTVSGSTWTASASAQAVGWEWDFAADPSGSLPTDASDERVYDPAGNGPGVNITAMVDGLSCEANAVQTVNVAYSGMLMDGELNAAGVVVDQGSTQEIISDGCGEVPDPVPQGPGTLRLLRKPIPGGGGDPSAWACPSLAEFKSALPTP